jgi:hypothetical protein
LEIVDEVVQLLSICQVVASWEEGLHLVLVLIVAVVPQVFAEAGLGGNFSVSRMVVVKVMRLQVQR